MKKFTLGFLTLVTFGASAQAPLNPGFENWENDTIDATVITSNPVDWNTSNNLLLQLPGGIGSANVTQETTMANVHSGTSAAKLSTLNLGFFMASGVLTTGDIAYVNNNFAISGGQPYTSRPGTLSGWFKYTPVGVDSCRVYAVLTKWNTATSSRDTIGATIWHNSAAVNTYTMFQAPIAYQSTEDPDTLLVVALSSAGMISGGTNSTLWIDDVNLEFGAGVNAVALNDLRVYPNPTQNMLHLNISSNQHAEAYIFDLSGRLVTSLKVAGNSVDVTMLNSGQYILELRSNSGVMRSTFAKQ